MVRSRFKKIKGTKDFMVMAVVCTFLCLWAIRDAWFPTQKILKKHPLELAVAAKVPGVVKTIAVKPGIPVEGEMVLFELTSDSYEKAIDAAEAAFKEAKEGGDAAVIQARLDQLLAARENLKACVVRNTDVLMNTSHGDDALKGVVLKLLTQPATPVQVMKAKAPGKVSKITDSAVFVTEEGSSEDREYPLGENMAPVVRPDEEIKAGSALAGTPVLLVQPADTFYIFNKTLAIFSFIGAIAALIFHRIAS